MYKVKKQINDWSSEVSEDDDHFEERSDRQLQSLPWHQGVRPKGTFSVSIERPSVKRHYVTQWDENMLDTYAQMSLIYIIFL